LLLAIKINPNYGTAHQYYSELLDILRQYDEAHLHINIALELDPFFYMYHLMSSIYYYHEGRLKESLEETKIESELSPGHEGPYWTAFYIYVKQGEDLKAVETLQKIMLFPGRAARCLTAPPQIRTSSFPASGSSVIRFAMKGQKSVL